MYKKINKRYLLDRYRESIKRELDKNNIDYVIIESKADIFVIHHKHYLGTIACELGEEEDIIIDYIFALHNDMRIDEKDFIKDIKSNIEGVKTRVNTNNKSYYKNKIIIQKNKKAFSSQEVVKDYKTISEKLSNGF